MNNWPPTFDELCATIPGTAYSAYSKKIHDLLEANQKTRLCDDYDKKLLRVAVERIDSFAATAMSRLTFPLEQLSFVMPPNTVAGDEPRLKRWRAERAHFQCVEAAFRAREAILAGNFIEAIVEALDAGHFSRFALAEVGFEREQIRTRAGRANKQRAEQNREVVLSEAREVRMHCELQNKKYNITSIAGKIAAKHASEEKFPRAEAIRRILGRNRKIWESRRPSRKGS